MVTAGTAAVMVALAVATGFAFGAAAGLVWPDDEAYAYALQAVSAALLVAFLLAVFAP